jgi:hypothetical protein
LKTLVNNGVIDRAGLHPSSHGVARLQEEAATAGEFELMRAAESGEAGADDDDVGVHAPRTG